MSQPEAELKVSAEETKSKLIIERHERDKEMNNNKLMVQEPQKLVTDERLEKEKLSQEVANLKSKIILPEDPSKSKQAEAQISRLKEELETVRMQVVVKDKQIREQSVTEERLGDIREEMTGLKSAESARERAEFCEEDVRKMLTEKDEEIHKLRNKIELTLEESFYSPDRNTRAKYQSPHSPPSSS